MRKLIYLEFEDGTVQPSFTRFSYFDAEWWFKKNSTILSEMGIKGIQVEKLPDDFYLDWEKA